MRVVLRGRAREKARKESIVMGGWQAQRPGGKRQGLYVGVKLWRR